MNKIRDEKILQNIQQALSQVSRDLKWSSIEGAQN